MKNILEYNGYFSKIEFNSDDMVLFGKIEGITDLITFESEDATKIEDEFHRAVDDYLIFCEEVGKSPQKAYKGTFNIRISPSLHKEIALKALKNGETLNQTVENAIAEYIKPSTIEWSDLCHAILSARNEKVYKQTQEMWDNTKWENSLFFTSFDNNRCVSYNPVTSYDNRLRKGIIEYAGF